MSISIYVYTQGISRDAHVLNNRPLHVRAKEFNYCKLPVTSYPVAVVAEINTLNLMDNSKKYTVYFYIA